MKWYRIKALLLKYYFITLNSADRIFDIFYWPVIDVIIWGFTSYFIKQISSLNILSMALGGLILWLFVWRSAQDIAVYVLEDFWSKTLYHLFSSPVMISEHITSIVLFGFLRSMFTFFFLAALMFMLYSFNVFTIPLALLASSIAILSLFGWAMGLFITGLILRFGQRIQVLAWSLTWIIQPFSCVFYPLSALPQWAVPIAKVLPTTQVFETLRSVIFPTMGSQGNLWYALVSVLLFLVGAGWFLGSSFKKAKKNGMLVGAE
ncbi:ABC transporter permease [Candidatus Woesearchaeota archaeon]|nr:MAG: hypothetical protein QS99_C0001G0087 [archaeon GW2011_AR4]MBS3129298.1 ABC transporter permease [Candidatus Woesearchaeota archaeon]HIH38601.1 ABC transporter permease [Candidatus Woesearchaeota archaeon]HIH48604.1 ABC transporter permease [Candidatus Woesearchaeota archaeon]HIJ02805.1 ABC transporter permease [Candidatus Woesearchaeota archaeon]